MKIPFFSKKKRPQNTEVIDIGLLRTIDERNRAAKVAPFQSTSAAPGPAATEDNLGFLGAMASAATGDDSQGASSTSSAASETSGYSNYFNSPVASSSSIDIERFERLRRRIDNAIQRIELIERKIDRIERRVDIKY
ncbi:MAG: hypothetical protein ACPLXC_03015 [Candidatus Pacearchaeota archaeon]